MPCRVLPHPCDKRLHTRGTRHTRLASTKQELAGIAPAYAASSWALQEHDMYRTGQGAGRIDVPTHFLHLVRACLHPQQPHHNPPNLLQ